MLLKIQFWYMTICRGAHSSLLFQSVIPAVVYQGTTILQNVTTSHHRIFNLQQHCCGNLDSSKISISFKSVVFVVSQIQALSRSAVCREPSEYLIQPLDLLNGILASLIVLVIGKLIYDYWSFKKTGKLPWLVAKMP